MNDDVQVPDDSQSKRGQKERAVQRHWFDKQPETKQAEIIKPHFEQAHPTADDIKDAVKEYDGNQPYDGKSSGI